MKTSSLLLFFLVSAAEAQRLPVNAVPDNYRLFLSPDLTAGTFSGKETINIRPAKPSSEIVLNSLDLQITSDEVVSAGMKQSAQIAYDRVAQTARFTFPKAVKAGPAALALEFKASPGKDLHPHPVAAAA